LSQEKSRKLEFVGEGFTTLYNSIIRDENLSLRARGLMAWIQSHNPDKFKFSKGSFLNISKKEGREAIQKAKKELIENGYLEIKCYKDDSGKFNYRYIFGKGGAKLSENQKTVHGETEHGKPVLIRNNKEERTTPNINTEPQKMTIKSLAQKYDLKSSYLENSIMLGKYPEIDLEDLEDLIKKYNVIHKRFDLLEFNEQKMIGVYNKNLEFIYRNRNSIENVYSKMLVTNNKNKNFNGNKKVVKFEKKDPIIKKEENPVTPETKAKFEKMMASIREKAKAQSNG
jgi:hypothetical protein